MTMVVYSIFASALYLLTVTSKQYNEAFPVVGYLLAIVMIYFFVLNTSLFEEDKRIRQGVIMMGLLMNVGMSVYYMSWINPEKAAKDGVVSFFDMLRSIGVIDVCTIIGAFVVTSTVICYTKIHRSKVLNRILMVVLPVIVYGARVTGKEEGGSYLRVCGVMVFTILAFWPFVAATFMDMEERRYIGGDVRKISWNMILLLAYECVLFMGAALCNEFGLLLIIAVTGSILFMIRCKSLRAKTGYSVSCIVAASVIAVKVAHIHDRIEVLINPLGTSKKQTAESILFIFRNLSATGYWGNGIGSLPKAIYPQFNTDYVLVLLMNDYSIVLAAGVVMLVMLYCKWLFKVQSGLSDFDRYVNLTIAMTVMTIAIIHILSNLGSFIAAGLPLAFVSKAPQINTMFGLLMGVHTGLLKKERFQWYEEEDTSV